MTTLTKQQLERYCEESIIIIGILLICLISFTIVYIYSVNNSYNKDLQDGQANCTISGDILKMNSFELEVDNTKEFTIWYSFYDKIEYRGLLCPEGFKLNITSPKVIGCVKK